MKTPFARNLSKRGATWPERVLFGLGSLAALGLLAAYVIEHGHF